MSFLDFLAVFRRTNTAPPLKTHEITDEQKTHLCLRNTEILIDMTNAIELVVADLAMVSGIGNRRMSRIGKILNSQEARPNTATWQIFMSVIGRTSSHDWAGARATSNESIEHAQSCILEMQEALYSAIWDMCSEHIDDSIDEWWRMPPAMAGGQYRALFRAVTGEVAPACDSHPLPHEVYEDDMETVSSLAIVWMRYNLCLLVLRKMSMSSNVKPEACELIRGDLMPPQMDAGLEIVSKRFDGEDSADYPLDAPSAEFLLDWLMMEHDAGDVIKMVAYTFGEAWHD